MSTEPQQTPAFDLSDLELKDMSEMTVKKKNGVDDVIGEDGVNPITIELFGPGSPEGLRQMLKAGRQAQQRASLTYRGKIPKDSAEVAEQEEIDKCIALTGKISNWNISKRDLYSQSKYIHIRKQAITHLTDESNF